MDKGEEEEEDDYEIQNNMLEGDISSPFAEAESDMSDEDVTEPFKVAPEKKLDKAIMQLSSSAQKSKVMIRLSQTDMYSIGRAYKANARSKPVLFAPKKM